MGIIGALFDKLKSTIPPEQHNGAEDLVAGLGGGAALAAGASAASKPISSEVAELAQSVASNIPVIHNIESGYISTPGDGMGRGSSMAKTT